MTNEEEIAGDAMDLLIRHGLRNVSVLTDSHIITVRETTCVEEDYPELKTEIKEIDL